MIRQSTVLLAVLLPAALVAACTSSTASRTAPPPTHETTPVPRGAAATTRPSNVGDQAALDYTGGAAASADPHLTPVLVGFVNEQGGVPAYPDAGLGAMAAVEFINAKLGGVHGHPLRLDTCVVQTAEDGRRCGERLAAAPDVSLVMTGTLVVGNQPLLDVLRGKKPVVLSNPLTAPEYAATDAYSYTPGPPGVVRGLALFAANGLVPASEAVAVVHGTDASSSAAFGLVEATLAKHAAALTAVEIGDRASPTEVAGALAATGADHAGALIILTTMPGCIATADAVRLGHLTMPVLATTLCTGAAMEAHLHAVAGGGAVPDGWYVGGYGYNVALPGSTQLDLAAQVVREFAAGDTVDGAQFTGAAALSFGAMLTVARFYNALEWDHATPEALRTAAQRFTGPMWAVAGRMACGADAAHPALCGGAMGVERYRDGGWVPVADAVNGKAIELSNA